MDLFYWSIGRLLYRLGYRKTGFKMVAMSIAGDFGLCKKTREWLLKNCPYDLSYCRDCSLWTCDGRTL